MFGLSTKHEALGYSDFETTSALHVDKIVCTTQRVTRDVVPILANPFNWRVRWPRPVRIPLFSLGLKVLGVACGHSGRLLTHYRPREVRNSIYRYGQIHIDYRSKDSYRFILTISIIYGNTTCKACNRISHTRHQYDKHLELNHLGQQYRWYHCQKNFRTKKERISHAITVHPNAQAKSYPPGVFPPGDLWAPLKRNQIDIPTKVEHRPSEI